MRIRGIFMAKCKLSVVIGLIGSITIFTKVKAVASKPADSVLVLTNGNILDELGGHFIQGKDIVISNGKIIALTSSAKKWKAAKWIDLKGKFIVPGLIDAHVHVTGNRKNNIENTYKHLDYFLRHGITSVRDAAGDGAALRQAQTAIGKGERSGASVYFAAFMAGDWYFNRGQHLRNEPYKPWEQLLTPATNLDSAMAEAKACGATGVKLYHSFDGDFLKLVVSAAKRHGLKAWGHTMMYPATPTEVVGAGLEVLSHVSMLENLTTDTLFFRRKTSLAYKDSVIAHLDINAFCRMMNKNNAILDATLCVSEERDPWVFSLLKRIHQKGVEIAAGTDQIVVLDRPYPRLLDELGYFVDKCGFTNAEALRSATVVGARVIGQEKHIGTIKKNKQADLLVLNDNPLLNIQALADISYVIKAGKIME
jgi:imidazolonepropionase-like amidohydrolase